MSKPILSIILPLYNASEHIAELFASLAQQTGVRNQNIEVLLWDDGSTDSTIETLQQHLSLLNSYASARIFQNLKNQGLFRTRMLAASKARGEFITFIDKQTRPYPDYLRQLLQQGWPLVVGNPVMDKTRSPWDRILFLIRRKLYFPYFGFEFPDLTLTAKQYRHFKNKGGGGALFVKRSWFLEVAEKIPAGKHLNDDSLLITELTKISPLRKTAKAKLLYKNRTGMEDNIRHLFWRGPKFIDYYLWPWNRYSPIILGGLIFLLAQLPLLAVSPRFVLGEIVAAIATFGLLSFWLSEEPADFLIASILLPIATLSFSLGCLLGIGIKLQRVIRK